MSHETHGSRSGWSDDQAPESSPNYSSTSSFGEVPPLVNETDRNDPNVDQGRVEELERQLMIGNLKVKRQRRPSMARSTGVRIIRHGVKLFPESSD